MVPLSDQALRSLREIAGAAGVHTQPAQLLTYARDAGFDQGRPDAVVLPVSAEQVAALVRWAAANRVPVTGRGAGTGQTGGAVAAHGGLMLVFANMRRVLALDATACQALVEPGITTENLDRTARRERLVYPPDPASGRAATIGGNVGENAGGPRCLKYGVTANYVLGLETVLADGSLVTWGGPALDVPQVNFLDLLVGCEGTLALVTKARLRLVPQPEAVGTMLAAFKSPEQAGQAVSAIIRSGLRPAALEMMDGLLYSAVERYAHMDLPPGAGALLIADVEGYPESLASKVRTLEETARPYEPLVVRLATDAAAREAIWYARKSAFAATALIAPDDCSMDIVVPRSRLPEAFREIAQMGQRAGYQVGYLAHAGDGNIHPEIFCDLQEPQALERVHRLHDQVIAFVVNLGGSISGEHGVGMEKQRHLALMYGPGELQAMLDVKAVFDPLGLLNPGKIFPEGVPAVPGPVAQGHHDLTAPLCPSTAAELQEILAELQAQRCPAWLGGSGTKCAPPTAVTRISTRGLSGILTRAYDDLYVTVGAGANLAEVRAELASEGFTLPLAAPWPEATVGGTIAAQFNAPWRAVYGGVRDVLLCADAVLPDGRHLRLGRPLVKDVAGYSLHKLFTGSFGALGALTAVSLRVFPHAPARQTWRVACPDLNTATAVAAIWAQPAGLTSALLLMRGTGLTELPVGERYHVVCTIEGAAEDVEIAEQRCRRALAEARLPAPTGLEVDGTGLWSRALEPASIVLRAGTAPGALQPLLAGIPDRPDLACIADLANGLLYLAGRSGQADAAIGLAAPVGAPARPASQQAVPYFAGLEAHLRATAETAGGYALALGRAVYPPRGFQASAQSRRLLSDLKHRWDPAGILNAGVLPE